VLILTWIRTYKLRKVAVEAEIPTQLSMLLLRDGTVYFGAILALNVTSIAAFNNSSASASTVNGLTMIENIVQFVLLSRFMFCLREAYLSDQSGHTSHIIGSRGWSSLHFTAGNIIGNIGAPLIDDSLGEWFTSGADEDREPPSPVVCNDPFVVGLIKEPEEAVEMITLSGLSKQEFTADDILAVTSSAV